MTKGERSCDSRITLFFYLLQHVGPKGPFFVVESVRLSRKLASIQADNILWYAMPGRRCPNAIPLLATHAK